MMINNQSQYSQIYPWQQSQWQNLLQRLNADALPHALLLTGLEGMGQLNFAMALAARLLCTTAQPFNCGQCSSCQLFHAGTHPDLLLIQPETEGKMIKVEQIRQLVDTLNKTAQQGGYQIAIIEPAAAMNIAAANALLKTLEEPAGKVILILISATPTALPATIRSRCQQIHFQANRSVEIVNWLQQHHLTGNQLTTLLARAENAPLLALKFAEPEMLKFQQNWLNAIIAVISQQQDPCKIAAQFINHDLEVLLSLLQQFIYDWMRIQFNLPVQYLAGEELKQLQIQSQRLNSSKLMSLLDEINTIKAWLSQHVNLNQQLVLEGLLIKLNGE